MLHVSVSWRLLSWFYLYRDILVSVMEDSVLSFSLLEKSRSSDHVGLSCLISELSIHNI
jgi:hypothetical protein